MKEGWCWRAAERRSQGKPAPEDPMRCLSPCPGLTEKAASVLEVVGLAHSQLRTAGMDGVVVGLDWNVIARLADDAEQVTDPWFWSLVSVAEGELVTALRPKPKTEG